MGNMGRTDLPANFCLAEAMMIGEVLAKSHHHTNDILNNLEYDWLVAFLYKNTPTMSRYFIIHDRFCAVDNMYIIFSANENDHAYSTITQGEVASVLRRYLTNSIKCRGSSPAATLFTTLVESSLQGFPLLLPMAWQISLVPFLLQVVKAMMGNMLLRRMTCTATS